MLQEAQIKLKLKTRLRLVKETRSTPLSWASLARDAEVDRLPNKCVWPNFRLIW